ncbi:DUF1801 domain-containing protein [Pelobium sp.]|nr:DUF1801 domain-containing protein [Pelobium sp.]MDA9554967.1 DUF1801 domain-containing protein [Pelobium sp.]
MQSIANTVEQYLSELNEDRKVAMQSIRAAILENLPKGFEETMNYGMITYVVPHSIYPKGYHCNPKQALPLLSIASQKNFIAIYHMGIYANETLFNWFVNSYPKYLNTKLDMGKSCIRFKKMEQIPYELIGELAAKMTVEDWIMNYEKLLKR